jgi:hypothetical protein
VKIYFNKLTEKQIDEQILKPYLESELKNFNEFDPKSIMLYVFHSRPSYVYSFSLHP